MSESLLYTESSVMVIVPGVKFFAIHAPFSFFVQKTIKKNSCFQLISLNPNSKPIQVAGIMLLQIFLLAGKYFSNKIKNGHKPCIKNQEKLGINVAKKKLRIN